MITLVSKNLEHRTVQGEIWDVISHRNYRDEHGMAEIMDANYDHRFVDEFPGDVLLALPRAVSLEFNFHARPTLPDLQKLLPWL